MPIIEITGAVSQVSKDIADPLRHAQEGYDTLIQCLEKTIGDLKNCTSNIEINSIFEKYFKLPTNGLQDEVRKKIRRKLKTTLEGLQDNDIKIKIEFFSSVKSSNQKLINLAVAQFKNKNQIVRYLLHEATHLYPRTDDHSDRGYVNNDGNFRANGLSHEEAINNADSFACAVVVYCKIPLV